ncbi:MAG: hypothetical protein U0325_26510 [Polyangiales bacterium]
MLVSAAVAAEGCRTDPQAGPGIFDAGNAADVVTPADTGAADASAPADRPAQPDVATPADVVAQDVPAAPMDSSLTGLAGVRAAIVGGGMVTLNVALTDLVVTGVVAATPGVDGGVSANDPGGFFVQEGMTGPAAFVAIDPASLSPAPQAGDRVSFTVTQGRASAGAKWITAVTGYARAATGVSLAGLTQDLSGAADLATGIDGYESELVRVQGTASANFTSAGTGFESAQITTAGVPMAMTNLRLRVASALRMSLGLRAGCTFTVAAPLWRFNAQTQVHAWAMSDISNVNCPAIVDAGVLDASSDSGALDAGGADVTPADVPAINGPDVAASDAGAEPAPTEVWVLRVGTGSAALNNQATAAFIERVRISDGMDAAPAIPLPTVATGSNQPLTISGSASSDGQLTRSADRRYVVLAGYATALGSSDAGVATGTGPRVVARVAANGTVDSSTLLGSAFSGGNVRGAASVDGLGFWAFGQSASTGGLVEARLGGTASSPVVSTPTNVRYAAIYDGALYGAVSQVGGYGVFRVNGSVGTLLPGFPTASGPSRYGFVAFDRDSTPGIDTIYQCDDGSVSSMTGQGGVYKHTLMGGTWTSAGPYRMGLANGCRAITGFVDGSNVTLLLTAGDSANRIYRASDTGGAPDATMWTEIRRAATNTAFRGIALAPR